ncbi:MAG: hypothetical protein R6U32_00885 [Candidatus Woesearchaeota archaeon]
MISRIRKMMAGKRAGHDDYLCWGSYKRRVDFISEFNFQQHVRRQNLANS